jgi:hypothetical protein
MLPHGLCILFKFGSSRSLRIPEALESRSKEDFSDAFCTLTHLVLQLDASVAWHATAAGLMAGNDMNGSGRRERMERDLPFPTEVTCEAVNPLPIRSAWVCVGNHGTSTRRVNLRWMASRPVFYTLDLRLGDDGNRKTVEWRCGDHREMHQEC